MLKPTLAVLLSLFIYNTAFAQKDTSVYYLKSSGNIVATKQEADFYIEILPADKNGNKDLYPANGYYLNGNKLFLATSLTNSLPLKLQGSYTFFSMNGSKTAIRHYDHGEPTGDILHYYPNGRFYNKQTYVTTMDTTQLQFLDCSDSTGKALAVNGNGYWITYNDDFSRVIENGKIVNGLKDSIWQMYPGEKKTYYLFYKSGKIIENENSSSSLIYTSVEQMPSFAGGSNAFGTFLARTIRYPQIARQNNVQGRVVISFVVEMDGSLSDVKVAKGVGSGLDEEALRVIKACPNWVPGMQNGKRVRVAYSVPIGFTLVNDDNK